MAALDYKIMRNASNTDALPVAGSDLLLLWDTAVANVGSGITYSGGTFTLGETGNFLVLYSDQWGTTDTTANERTNAKTTITLAGSEIIPGYATGYVRRSGGSQEFINFGAAIINVATTTGNGDDLQIRTERIDNSTAGTVNRIADRSGITIIKLDDTWGYGRYTGTAFNTSTTDNVATTADLSTTDEEDSPFTRTTNTIDVATNNLVLAVYSLRGEDPTPSGRAEYQARLTLAGTVVPGSYTQTYGPRVTDNCDWAGMSGICLLEPTSGQDVELEVVSREGGNDSFEASLQLVELPSGAEACIVEATTGNFNTADTNFAWDTNPRPETAAFTHTAGQANIDVDNAGDYLVMASQATTTQEAATRAVPALSFEVNTTNDETTGNSSYHRNTGTAEWSAMCCGTLLTGLIANDSIYALNDRIGTVTTTINNNVGGMSVIRLSSLAAGSDTEVNTLYNANNTLAIVEYVASIDLDIKGTAAALTLTEYAASITAYPAFDNQAFDDANAFSTTSFSLESSGGTPTNVNQGSVTPLTLTEYVASIDLDIKGATAALTLATYDANIGIDIKAGTDALVVATYDANIGIDLKAGFDALAIATYDANIGWDVQAGVDALTLATYQSTVSLGVDIGTNVDALTLAEQQATIVYDVTVDTNVDALVVATYDANIGIDVKAGTDALVVATYDANIGIDLKAGVDALAIVTYQSTVDLGAGTPVNVDAITDALTLTEYQAAVNAATNIAAKVWASELVSLTANINAAINVDTNVDALTVATYQATAATGAISFDNTSFDEPNAFDVNAFAINAEISDTEVSATTDALVLTENQATVLLDVYVDQQATTALTLTEYVADIGFVLPAVIAFDQQSFDEPNAFSINSFAIEVGTPGVNTNLAELILTEYSASIFADREVSAGTDALTLTTYAAQLDQDTSIDANTDALVLTEYQANIANAGVMMAGSTALTINENKASISVSVQGSSDALTLTEYQSTITLDVNVQTNVDGLILSESSAAIEVSANDVEVAAGRDILNLVTYSATIVKDAVVETNVDSLVITTYQAEPRLNLRVRAGVDALVINTFSVDTPIFTPNVRAVPVSLILREYPAFVFKQNKSGANLDELREKGKKRLTEEKLRKETLKRVEEHKEELAEKIFGEEPSVLEEIIKTGKGEISGMEVEIDPLQPPQFPIDELAPQLEQIKDGMDREIASLIRAQEEAKFKRELAEHQLKVQRMEEELIAFLILAMDD